jgi:SAM-dependent methyltransferase
MLDALSCPVCGHDDWQAMRADTWHPPAPDAPESGTRLRLQILIEHWAPGHASLTLTHQRCRACGLVVYTPRPTEADLATKYGILGGATSSSVEAPTFTRIDEVRSRELQSLLAPHLPPGGRVLDFGGGTGSLMHAFLQQGHACDLVDYALHAVPGVRRVGQTPGDLPPDQRWDLIVASHVLEHMAHPLDAVHRLAHHLTAGGHLYVEVPMELQGGPPRRREPVTHINFFSPVSARALLHRAGLEAVRCEVRTVTHCGGGQALAVCALGRASGAPPALRSLPPDMAPWHRDLDRWLQPGVLGRARTLARHPRLLASGWTRRRLQR